MHISRGHFMPWFALVALAGVAGFFAYDRHTTCVALIEGALKRHHFTQITTSFQWMDFDDDNFTYEVTYVNAAGKQCQNTCKVRSSRFPDDDRIFWSNPI